MDYKFVTASAKRPTLWNLLRREYDASDIALSRLSSRFGGTFHEYSDQVAGHLSSGARTAAVGVGVVGLFAAGAAVDVETETGFFSQLLSKPPDPKNSQPIPVYPNYPYSPLPLQNHIKNFNFNKPSGGLKLTFRSRSYFDRSRFRKDKQFKHMRSQRMRQPVCIVRYR